MSEMEQKTDVPENQVSEEILQHVRKKFEQDRFATENGAVVEAVGDGYARCAMVLSERHMNAVGGVMGGAIFMLADFAFAVASNWNGTLCVSQTAQITYLSGCKGTKLTAEAKRIREGRSTCYYLIDLKDDRGNHVAQVTSSGFIKR